MKKFIIILLGIAASLLPAAEDSLMLFDFENPRQTKRFVTLKDNANKVTFNTNPEYIASGKGSALFYVPKGGSGEHKWPRARVGIKDPALQDWSLYDNLQITFFNPDPTPRRVTVSIRTEKGKGQSSYHVPVPHGKKVFVMPLNDVVKEEKVVLLSFVCTAPPEEQTIYMDDIKLTVSDESVAVAIESIKKRIIRESAAVFWENAGMKDIRNGFFRKLEKLAQSKDRPLVRSRQIVELLKKYLTAKQVMWKKANARLLKEFERYSEKNPVWDWCYVSGCQKIYQDTLPFVPELDRKIIVELARRESEGVQIVLRSKKDLQNVQVKVVPVKAVEGLSVKAVPVGFVQPPTGGYPSENMKIVPDVLLEFMEKINIAEDKWQPFWLDVKAAPGCPAGEYKFTATFSADNAPDLTVPFTVNVWNFELPEFPSTPALINYHTDTNHAAYIPKSRRQKVANEFISYRRGQKKFETLSDEAKNLRTLEIAAENMLLQHRVTPAPLYITLRRLNKADVQRWREQGGKYFSVTYLQPHTVQPDKPFPAWVKRKLLNNLKATVPLLEKAGLMDGAYCYAFDEIGFQKFYAAKELMTEVKKLYPDLRLVTTMGDYNFGTTNGMDKLIDVWCPQVEKYVKHIDKIKEVRKQGKKVWYYCCNYDPGIDMILEKPLTAPRLLTGMALQKFEADGFLYYNVQSGNKRQDMITSGPVTTHTGNNGSKYNGCGLLIYPTAGGPVPSLRLKALRDGFDDSDYIYMLKNIPTDKLTAEEKIELQSLLHIPDSVIVYLDPENYDQTGQALLDYRNRIGKFLNRVYSKAK